MSPSSFANMTDEKKSTPKTSCAACGFQREDARQCDRCGNVVCGPCRSFWRHMQNLLPRPGRKEIDTEASRARSPAAQGVPRHRPEIAQRSPGLHSAIDVRRRGVERRLRWSIEQLRRILHGRFGEYDVKFGTGVFTVLCMPDKRRNTKGARRLEEAKARGSIYRQRQKGDKKAKPARSKTRC